ncbi:SLC13 family permease [Streptomyces malaysiensis subsp. malaysiensis]|uniref:CitMHS family transporter n=1 Tax=Streptomyces malaysiensis TaxID=92644 RepID=UPI0024BF9944|nr:SLC13 family permease [Streptomyces sp. NA07423]WHX22048.1 SLC13 family permease [Streptomyces sp. NA07423]
MLVILGFAMIATFLYLITTKRMMPVAALILVPIIFGLLAGGGLSLSDDIAKSIEDAAPTAALLFFAITFFGVMIDIGLFDPLIRGILRVVHNDPVKVVVGTALLSAIVSLDGDGSTTFIIVTSAFLPVYLRLGMSPVVLTCVTATANGVLNTVPWGGSTARAAAALKVSPIDIFVPMIPAITVGLVATLFFAYFLGRSERRRLGTVALRDGVLRKNRETNMGANDVPTLATAAVTASSGSGGCRPDAPADPGPSPSDAADTDEQPLIASDGHIHRPNARPKLRWINLILTLIVMTLLVEGTIEPAVVFFIGVSCALILNFRQVAEQRAQLEAHASSVVNVVGMVFAATVLTGVLSGSGMVKAMADWLVGIIPESLGGHFPIIGGLLSIPMTFFTSNDAFYFGMLPVLNETASHFGITSLEMARASLVGQPLHQSSPIVASFLLLVGLAKVDLGDHHRKAIWRAAMVGLIMLGVGCLTLAFPV